MTDYIVSGAQPWANQHGQSSVKLWLARPLSHTQPWQWSEPSCIKHTVWILLHEEGFCYQLWEEVINTNNPSTKCGAEVQLGGGARAQVQSLKPSRPSPDSNPSLHEPLSGYPQQPLLIFPNPQEPLSLSASTCLHSAMIAGCGVSNKVTNVWRTEIFFLPILSLPALIKSQHMLIPGITRTAKNMSQSHLLSHQFMPGLLADHLLELSSPFCIQDRHTLD